MMSMTPTDVWPAIMADHAQGLALHTILRILNEVPTDALIDAMNRIERETTIGPMTNPTAYLDGRRFDNARVYQTVLRHLAEIRGVMEREMEKHNG